MPQSKDQIKSLIRPLHSSVSIKFFMGLTFLVAATFALIVLIYTWDAATLQDANTIKEESSVSSLISNELQNYLSKSRESLAEVYLSSPNTNVSSNFDIGIIGSVNGKITELNFNDTKFTSFENFTRTITPQTPIYSYDRSSNVIYVVLITPNGYEAGAIDASGATIKNLLATSYYSTALTDNKGNILDSNNGRITTNMLSSLKVNYDYYQQIKFGNFNKEIFTYSPINNTTLGVAVLSSPIGEILAPNLQEFMFYIILIAIILFLAITVIFSLLVAIPLTSITVFFDSYAKGEVRQIKLSADDTFGMIGDNINRLIEKVSGDFKRIEQEDQIQNDFLLLSGHILRTPLSSIQGYLDILISQDKNLLQNKYIQQIQETLFKLIGLVENILTISKGNDEVINAPVSKNALGEIMEEAYYHMKDAAKEKNINFILDDSNVSNLVINVNKKNFVLAIHNLLDNAIKFTSEGGTVKLYSILKENGVIISVSDTGIGLTKEESEQIFKKFSKISDTMEYNSEGFGIGLYVTKLIAERYNGKVWVDSIKGSGSIFNIMLPLGNA